MSADDGILVVEDSFLLARAVQSALEAHGFRVVGPAATVRTALQLTERTLSAAVLDIQLGQDLVTPVALRLRELGVPFLFLSSYADLAVLPETLRTAPLTVKPATDAELVDAVRRLLSSP